PGINSEIPEVLHDRAADNWRPLLAIADHIGGLWPELARQAAATLSGTSAEVESIRVMLLSDIRDIFGNKMKMMASAVLCSRLAMLEGRPWPEFGKSCKPITPTQLARLLSPFGIDPRTIRLDDSETAKGY